MKRSCIQFALVAGLVAVLGSCAPTVPKFEFKYAEKRAALPNGLKLVVIPDKNTKMVQVDVRYEVGSNEDPPGKAGLAHLVEHMMFQHRFFAKDPKDSPPTFELLPMISPGGYNAYTIWEKTHYYLITRNEDVGQLLRLEATRMSMGCKTIPEAEFERERDVVRNEIRQRGGGPEGKVIQLILDAAYPKGHAYNQTTGGNDEQLSNIKFQDVCDFLKNYYTPDRATVVVVGNVEIDTIGKQVAEYFGPIPKGNAAPRKVVEDLPDFTFEKIEKKLDIERSLLTVMWRMPKIHSKDWAAVRVLASSMNGRLARFREDWDFAASAGAFVFEGANGPAYSPIFVVQMELYKYSDVDKALGYVWKAAEGAHLGISGDGFDARSKNLAKASLISSLEPISRRADHVADLIQFDKRVEFGSTKEYLFHELEQIDKIDADGFKSFVRSRLKKDKAKVLVIQASTDGEQGDERSTLRYTASNTHDRETTSILDPSEAKKALPAPEGSTILAAATRFELGNGMKVIFLPLEGGMPMVSAHLMFNVGSAHEDPDKAGLAQLAANFLGPPRDSDFWITGVQFGALDVSSDSTTFVGRGMEIYLEVIVKGLERIIKAGYIGQKGIERWQKRQKLDWQSELQRQNVAFGKEFRAALFGKDHPYTTTGSATESSYPKMGMDLLNGFVRKHYTAGNATLVVVGSFDPKKARELIEDNFGSWSKGRVDKPVTTALRTRTGPDFFGIIGKKHPQVRVLIGYPGVAGIDDQHAARMILQAMLNKRMAKVRSQLGSTYGVRARWSPSIGPSAYFIAGGIDAPRAGESVKFMREKIAELREGKDFDVDFAEARRAVLKRLTAESSETMTLAARLAYAAKFNLPVDYNDKLIKQVAALTMDAVKQVMAKELDPSKEVIGALGDREALEKMFSDAGLNDARFIEPK